MDKHELARAMIEATQTALARGVKHYAPDGQELTTPEQIIRAMLEHEYIEIEEPQP